VLETSRNPRQIRVPADEVLVRCKHHLLLLGTGALEPRQILITPLNNPPDGGLVHTLHTLDRLYNLRVIYDLVVKGLLVLLLDLTSALAFSLAASAARYCAVSSSITLLRSSSIGMDLAED
jgi:hypothetical protein